MLLLCSSLKKICNAYYSISIITKVNSDFQTGKHPEKLLQGTYIPYVCIKLCQNMSVGEIPKVTTHFFKNSNDNLELDLSILKHGPVQLNSCLEKY